MALERAFETFIGELEVFLLRTNQYTPIPVAALSKV
jgi:hypothetical protein